jgi:hypothetical protein
MKRNGFGDLIDGMDGVDKVRCETSHQRRASQPVINVRESKGSQAKLEQRWKSSSSSGGWKKSE